RRSLPVADLLLTPADAVAESRETTAGGATLEHRLHRGELIVGYRLPVDAASKRSVYLKVRDRASYAYALVSAAACLSLRDGAVETARVALGSVAMKPWRLPRLESSLRGRPVAEKTLDAALDAAFAEARPRPGHDPQLTLARNTARRAVEAAAGLTEVSR
ncbi:MAG: xanthine dehydrogenase family protein subunit M, partial [Acidobacteriota bacterium]